MAAMRIGLSALFWLWLAMTGAFAEGAPPARNVIVDPRAWSALPSGFTDTLNSTQNREVGVIIATGSGEGRSGCYGSTRQRRAGGAEEFSGAEASDAPAGFFDPDTALRHAIAAAEASGRPARLVLIAQGPAACISIGCALSKDLAETYPDLRIDVIALDEAAEPLRCLATNSGGRFRLASLSTTAAALAGVLEYPVDGSIALAAADEAAAISETPSPLERGTGPDPGVGQGHDAPPIPRERPDPPVIAAPGPAGGGEPQPLAWAEPPPGAPEAMPTELQEGVWIRVLAGPKGPLITSDLSCEILSREGNGTYRMVGQSSAPNPHLRLPAGDFVARIRHGDVVREFPFTVTGQGIEHRTFSLDIGYLQMTARPTNDAAPLETGVQFTVSRLGQDGAGAAMLVRRESQPLVALPAGRYRVLAEAGAAGTVADIEVVAGTTATKDFNLELGYLRVILNASASPQFRYRVEAVETPTRRSDSVIASSEEASALYRLPAGRYAVIGEADGHILRRFVSVTAGNLQEVTLEMGPAANGPPTQ